MKQALFVIIFIILLSLTGCIQQKTVEEISYPVYSKGDKLTYIHFTLPDDEPRGQELEVTLTFPSGDVRGTFTRILNEREVDIYVQETLTESGNYRIEYNTDNFQENEYFFVGSTPEKVCFSILDAQLYGSELVLKIRNIGKENGKFYLVIYDKETSTSAGRTIYNREYSREIIDLRFGYDYTHRCYIGSQSIVVLINEKVYELEFT